MKELFLLCIIAAVFAFGYFIMKKLDAFLENNRRFMEAEITENSLWLAFENLMIIDSLMPLFEKFLKTNPDCQLHFLAGNPKNIYEKMDKNTIDFGFINYTASENDDIYNILIISPKQSSIFCENIGYSIEPLNPAEIQTAVLWKKASGRAFANRFSDFLLSNQGAINA